MTIKTLQKFGSMAELVHWLVNTGRAPDHAAAKRMVPSLIPKEAKFQTAILQYLNSLPHALFWKDSAGSVPVGRPPGYFGRDERTLTSALRSSGRCSAGSVLCRRPFTSRYGRQADRCTLSAMWTRCGRFSCRTV